MKFSELEKIMSEKGVYTLAEIARSLSTTPQAVSNWKGRDQVPYHVEAKLQSTTQPTIKIESNDIVKNDVNDNISISDILLVFSQQIKLILLIPFILVFTTFTYVMFIQKPLYTCEAKILLPSSQNTVSGGLAGLASQFGVSVPTTIQTDLSNPSMIPELLKSRTFAEKILEIEFYSEKFQKILPLISILLEVDQKSEFLLENIGNKSSAISIFTSMIEFEKSTTSPFNYIRITSDNAKLSRAILSVTVKELEEFNKFYRNKSVLEKIAFINNRIMSVKSDLEKSEQELKQFREQNRQISSSPSLQLLQDRLLRNVEIQKEIFMTLKQQLELAKIEEVQEASIFQVLDEPQLPLGASNKNLIFNVFLSGILGIGFSIFLAFTREYLNNSDIDERKKIRRVKSFLTKKLKDSIFDKRISGPISILLGIGLPFYLGHESSNPIYFGKYSTSLFIFNITYVISFVIISTLFLKSIFSSTKS